MPYGSERAALAACALASSACALSAGGVLTRPAAGNPLVLGGPSVEAELQLPPMYRTIAGIEWTRGDTPADLWRLGVLAGYSAPPEGSRRVGWEAAARTGLLRSWEGAKTGGGGFAGARVAALLRLGTRAEPWEGDRLFELTPLLVLDVGVNELFPPGRPLETEITARLLFRFHLSSTLLP
jgi:hypothetical protein